MPLSFVRVIVVRSVKTHLGGGDYAEADCPLAGSPFTGRVYRTLQKTTTDDEAGPGIAPLDEMQRLSIMDPGCPIQVNDICLLPLPNVSVQRAKVVRVRRYGDRTQFDLETGAEGDALLASAIGPALPPTVSVQAQLDQKQAQLDALTQELSTLQMAFSLPAQAQPDPIALFTTTGTLTRPTTNTVREVKPTANAVATLYTATGSGIAENFDVSALGGFTFAVALQTSDSYDANNAGVAAAIASLIANGAASFRLRDVAANTWHLE